MLKYSFYFYFLLISELLLFPIYFLINYYKFYFGFYDKHKYKIRFRNNVRSKEIKVCIHEWGGYNEERIKKVRDIKPFSCGLKHQIKRFEDASNSLFVDLTITISDFQLFNYNFDKKYKILSVSNTGMDFSGYNAFYQNIKNEDNKFVVLTNSSVNSFQSTFLDRYIQYLENNPTVGLLGVSYNTSIRQSFICNNFNPHLQSFFLLTTIDVLNEVVSFNKGFPGCNISNKRLLIRKGEVALSNIVMNLGYDLACVLENGDVFKFNKNCKSDNGRLSWEFPFGDYRYLVDKPNAINPINSII
jgi:hypothetical protein